MNQITAREAIFEYVMNSVVAGKFSQANAIEFTRAGNREISKRIEQTLDTPMDASEARSLASHVFTHIV